MFIDNGSRMIAQAPSERRVVVSSVNSAPMELGFFGQPVAINIRLLRSRRVSIVICVAVLISLSHKQGVEYLGLLNESAA
jgi:hypothetical protein